MIFDIANNKSDVRDLFIFGFSGKIERHKEPAIWYAITLSIHHHNTTEQYHSFSSSL